MPLIEKAVETEFDSIFLASVYTTTLQSKKNDQLPTVWKQIALINKLMPNTFHFHGLSWDGWSVKIGKSTAKLISINYRFHAKGPVCASNGEKL